MWAIDKDSIWSHPWNLWLKQIFIRYYNALLISLHQNEFDSGKGCGVGCQYELSGM